MPMPNDIINMLINNPMARLVFSLRCLLKKLPTSELLPEDSSIMLVVPVMVFVPKIIKNKLIVIGVFRTFSLRINDMPRSTINMFATKLIKRFVFSLINLSNKKYLGDVMSFCFTLSIINITPMNIAIRPYHIDIAEGLIIIIAPESNSNFRHMKSLYLRIKQRHYQLNP